VDATAPARTAGRAALESILGTKRNPLQYYSINVQLTKGETSDQLRELRGVVFGSQYGLIGKA
jgi:hypothetical protein